MDLILDTSIIIEIFGGNERVREQLFFECKVDKTPYKLHKEQDLFDKAFDYIREHY